MQLKYGTNPHQAYAALEAVSGGSSPVTVVNGNPSLINFLDALNAWPLVREVSAALGRPAAASFKHVSPAGVGVDEPLPDDLHEAYEVGGKELSPLATAYVRARGADPKSSFGDFIAVSEVVDEATARVIKREVSDGIIAPGFEPGVAEILASKKGGKYPVLRIDPDYEPPARESREVFGVRLTQDRNSRPVTRDDLADVVCGELTEAAVRDLLLGLITIKYTQSNSVAFSLGGQMIGIGAGQQSRVDCTKLASAKADTWWLRRHPKVLGLSFKKGVKRQDRINYRVRYIEGDLTTFEARDFADALETPAAPLTPEEKAEWVAKLDGVSLVSDGFIPFRDNIDHASRHGVKFLAQPGGSVADEDVTAACRDYGIAQVHTHLRLFHH